MMKLKSFIALSLALTAAPACAKWSVMAEGATVQIAGGGLTVVPPAGWNRWSTKTVKYGELWSLDGPLLNKLQFLNGVSQGQPLAREVNKKREPLPKFMSDMKSSDIADLIEQTVRQTEGAPDVAIDSVEPVDFAGRHGFRLLYHYTAGELTTRAEVQGAVIGGKLYLISFTAPALHYFDADLPAAHAVMASAKLVRAGS